MLGFGLCDSSSRVQYHETCMVVVSSAIGFGLFNEKIHSLSHSIHVFRKKKELEEMTKEESSFTIRNALMKTG